MALAEELGVPFSLAFALCYPGTIVSEMCGGDTGVVVERGLNVATEGGFSSWIVHGKVCRSYLRFKEQQSDSTLSDLQPYGNTAPKPMPESPSTWQIRTVRPRQTAG